jgi:hypothetical protein
MAEESSRKSKKPKVDLDELASKLWEHYRNYLDSCSEENNDNDENENENDDDDDNDSNDHGQEKEGDIDELQELLELASPHVQILPPNSKPLENIKSVASLLPVLVSVAHYHLADVAIGQYLQLQSQLDDDEDDNDDDDEYNEIMTNLALKAQQHLSESIRFFPENAGTWSMGANFGRCGKLLTLSVVRDWYERAVDCSHSLRRSAIGILENNEEMEMDDSSSGGGGTSTITEWVELLFLNQILGVEFVEGDGDGEEDEEDDEEQDEKKEQEEQEAYFSTSTVESTSRFMCAMLWSTAGKHDRAMAHLKHFPLTHRLHPNVWNGAGASSTTKVPSTSTTTSSSSSAPWPVAFRPKEGILPAPLYQHLLKVFAPDAAFWKESDYSNRGYYSFFSELQENNRDREPSNLIEDVVLNHLLPRVEQAMLTDTRTTEKICGFEWWAHTRPIQANLGHNLHFDTDESMLAKEGKITHPIFSSVLYLTGGGGGGGGGGGSNDDEAGATIVLDQTPDSANGANKCWRSFPQDNSLMAFPGNLLHGVLPCPGKDADKEKKAEASISTLATTSPADLLNQWQQHPQKGDGQEPAKNRLTFMVGFWTRNVPEMENRDLYSACGPLPPATKDHTWVQELSQGYGDNNNGNDHAQRRPVTSAAPKTMSTVPLPWVSPAWETIESTASKEEPPLQIPISIDHRFFVNGVPQCFRLSLLEDHGGECE